MITAFNSDCLEAMRSMKDNEFDLAIVDPMYIMPENYLIPGSNVSTTGVKRRNNAQAKKLSKLEPTGYDFYYELSRVSKHQIIWGINYYPFAGEVPGRVVWDKKNDASTFSNAEIASCSKIKGVRIFRYLWNGMLQENMRDKEQRIHAFQKPVKLYEWLLMNYAKQGDKILDTHGGSFSHAIACHNLGFDLTIFEIDKDYFDAGMKRLAQHQQQLTMF